MSVLKWLLLVGTNLAKAFPTQGGETELPGVAHQARVVSSAQKPPCSQDLCLG